VHGGGARVCNRKMWRLQNGVWLVASSIYELDRQVAQGPIDELVPGRSVRMTHVWGSMGCMLMCGWSLVREGLCSVN
jgi:hypothetical protein